MIKVLIPKLQRSRESRLSSGMNDPDMGLFVIEQTFVPDTSIKIGMFWPDQRKRASSAGRSGQQMQQSRQFDPNLGN